MPETVLSQQAPSSEQADRRRDPRQESHVQLEISTGKNTGRAWSADVSNTGVCFHSTQCLEPGFILVRQSNRPDRDFVELEIVRRRQLKDGIWEYGAVLGEFSANSVYEIPSSEYRELVDALKDVRTEAPESSDKSQQIERQLRLNLQQVANDSARGALRAHRAKRQLRRLRRVQALTACVGGVIVGGSFGVMDYPIGTWECLTFAVATLLLTDWLIAIRIRGG